MVNQPTPAKVTGRLRTLVILVDRGAYGLTRHWIAFVNVVLLLFLTPAFLAPVMMETGHTRLGSLFYIIYHPTCHQLPDRSYFLFGRQPAYTEEELLAAGMDPAVPRAQRRAFVGTADLGYKVAFCERDVAIYGGMVLYGLLYAWIGRPKRMRLPFWALLLLIAPMAVDGLTQLVGLRESTATLRMVTGLCVAAGSVWYAYPFIEDAMTTLRHDVARKLGLPLE